MRILHLSDIHIDKETIEDTKIIIDELLNILKKSNSEKKIDIIIISGDLINKGGLSFNNSITNGFLAFRMHLVDKLQKELTIERNRIIINIGNHDIDRNADSDLIEAGLMTKLISCNDVDKYYDSNPTEGNKRVMSYKNFEKSFYEGVNPNTVKLTNFETTIKLDIDGVNVGISSLNTAWRCNSTSNEILILGERQITNSYNFIKDCDVKIAVSHHHYSLLAKFERNLIEKQLNLKYDMYFTGHLHETNAQYCETPNGKMFTFVAPGVLSLNKYSTDVKFQNGFSIIDYDTDSGNIITTFYKQNYPNPFILNSDVTEGGIWTSKIPLGDEAKLRLNRHNLIMTIKEEYLPKTNEHLLSYNSETVAPKSIDEIFVMPNITSKNNDASNDPLTDLERQSISQYKISDLINSEKNFVLFGIKEVGKTVLLDKILIELLESQSNNTYLPVFIDFNKLQKDIESSIRVYWKLQKEEAKSILTKNKILLLIDNIIFDSEYYEYHKNLSLFIDKYPSVKFIGTSLLMYEEEVSIDTNPTNILDFEKVYIKQFQSKQIKLLINKWFPKNIRHENPKKFETLINAFLSLNLPRTPFAVSLFLYIIERQQNYRPQNNATLIERYIKDMLLNNEEKEYLRETFDYDNKIWLLSNIAFEMLQQDRDNYSLSYAEVIKIAESHLRMRKFPASYSSKKIIDEILKLGIFLEEGSNLRFRFNCFFEYFIVKKMQNDAEFLNFVLDEKNFLRFSNEIDYYTGLRRGENKILKEIVERLEYNYIDINDFVFSKINSVDDYYNINDSFVKKMSVSDLLTLLPEKKTDEKEEKISDSKLETCKKNDEIIKKKDSNKFNDFGKLLVLAMRVLKNSEEISIEDLKFNSYKIILSNSISYSVLFKMICKEMVKHPEKFGKERVDELNSILAVLPYLHQILISENLGTFKLAEIIKDKIYEDKNMYTVSEFERFLSFFLFFYIMI